MFVLNRYSLVGKVIATDPLLYDNNTKTNNWINKRVFSFSPHGTHHIVGLNNVQLVPDDIPSCDAIFLPSMVCCAVVLYM